MESENAMQQEDASAVHAPVQKKKTSFVTIAGWVMFGYGLYSALLGALFYAFLPDLSHVVDGGEPNSVLTGVGYLLDLFLENLPLLMLYQVFFAILLSVAGATLLRRREWGRMLAIGLLGWTILTSIAAMVFAGIVFAQILHFVRSIDAYAVLGAGVAGMITSLAWIVLYGYVIRKLTRPEIRAEFLS